MLAAHNQFILCAIWPTKCNNEKHGTEFIQGCSRSVVNFISVYHRHRQMANSEVRGSNFIFTNKVYLHHPRQLLVITVLDKVIKCTRSW